MLVLGLQGSPRLKGNTRRLLSMFLDEAEKLGARVRMIDVDRQNIVPCKEYIVCEKKGFCPIDDDMKKEIYSLLREAEVVVAATPIFFFNMTAQLKALVDRCQTFWARKYRFKLKDPLAKQRKGVLLAVGATKFKNLFDGLELGVEYFFDALDADYAKSLTYGGVEHPGDIEKHPSVAEDVRRAVADIVGPLTKRKRLLFVCEDNACLSQAAGAFAQAMAGERLDVSTAGINPAGKLDRKMAEAMAEKKIDLKFRKPRPVEQALENGEPEIVVCFGRQVAEKLDLKCEIRVWDMEGEVETDKSLEQARFLLDEIERRVSEFVGKR